MLSGEGDPGAMAAGSAKVARGAERAGQAGKALDEILTALDATVTEVDQIAGSAQALATPWQRSTLGFSRGWAGGFQITSRPSPISHRANSVGRSRGVPQG